MDGVNLGEYATLEDSFDRMIQLFNQGYISDNPIEEFLEGNYDLGLKYLENSLEDLNIKDKDKYLTCVKFCVNDWNIRENKKNNQEENVTKKEKEENQTNSNEQDMNIQMPSFEEINAPSSTTIDIKKLYSQKIASGDIDPIEISFADFEAQNSEESQNVAFDYKAIYSQMISE